MCLHHAFVDGVFKRTRQLKILNMAVVGAFAGGVAGALVGASTMFAVNVLMTPTASAMSLAERAVALERPPAALLMPLTQEEQKHLLEPPLGLVVADL